MNDDVHQGVLVPLRVPWMLGHVDTNFELTYSEGGELIVRVTATFRTGSSFNARAKKRIEIRFERVNQLAFGMGFDEDDMIELHHYSSNFESYGSDDDHNSLLDRQWYESGICPDPFAYEVSESLRLKNLRLETVGFREYLLIGDDPTLRVVAREFSWRDRE
jgi:hypothetical protein